MGEGLKHLANFYDRGGGEVSGRRLSVLFGEDRQTLLDACIFGRAIRNDCAPCACPEGDHAATVKWNDAKDAYRVRCPNGGKYWMAPEEVETHAFDMNAFRRAVSDALGVVTTRQQSFADETVHYPGDAMLGATRFPVFLVRDFPSPKVLNTVLDLDRRKIGNCPGVILTAELPAETLRGEHFHNFVTFCDVLDLSGRHLRRRSDALRRALGAAIIKMSPAASAAKLEEVVQQYRREFGKWPSARTLPDYAAAYWPEDQAPPGKTTCGSLLKTMRARSA